MRFIDHSDGSKQALRTLVFKKPCNWLYVCDVPPFRPSLVEVSCENQSNLHFDPQLLGCWVVMNIINGIAKGGSPCVLPPKSGP